MGCNELLARHLEHKLENGMSRERVKAAKELADVYALLLARDEGGANEDILQRAVLLFDRIPEAGTIDLRLQLYRATFIAAEQILERYRIRVSDVEEAEQAVMHLREVATKLETLQDSLQKKINSSRSPSEKKKQNLGMATSYLAWVYYYIAWFEDDAVEAEKSATLFAKLLSGDRLSLDAVSLDLKSYEIGARALLGIALCKSIMKDPLGSDPWFEELEDPSTWSSVRIIVPLWRFYLLVDTEQWDEILTSFDTLTGVDQTLLYRIAAVHALEHASSSGQAGVVAKQALAGLIEFGQLGVVSSIIDKYGSGALKQGGFIAKYIEGDIAYRKVREIFKSDVPAEDRSIQNEFSEIASIFDKAIRADDVGAYPALVDDCQFMLGLALFYSSQFESAAEAFQGASQGDNKKQATWMAIVSLNYIDTLTQEELEVKDALSTVYIDTWPNTKHANQLILQRSEKGLFDSNTVEDLLSISHSDPLYEDAQRQAARSLYQMWRVASPLQRSSVGNKYVSVAMPLMLLDLRLEQDVLANEICAVRAMRILESSLHHDVRRIVAAKRAVSSLDVINNRNIFPLDTFQNEISYRKIMVLLFELKVDEATAILMEMIKNSPEDLWTSSAALEVWNQWLKEKMDLDDELQFVVGSQIVRQLKDHEMGSQSYVDISRKTAQSAFDLHIATNDKQKGEEALRISRILVDQNPLIKELLVLNAEIEMLLGDKQKSLQRWKTIAYGSKIGTKQWLRAKYFIVKLLSENSPEDAIAILDQYVILYPSYGDDPFGTQLRLLHKELRGGEDGS